MGPPDTDSRKCEWILVSHFPIFQIQNLTKSKRKEIEKDKKSAKHLLPLSISARSKLRFCLELPRVSLIVTLRGRRRGSDFNTSVAVEVSKSTAPTDTIFTL